MDFLPPGSNLAIPDGPRREGITGKREKQNGIPSLISPPTTLVRGWHPHKLGAGIPRVWRDQTEVFIQKNGWELWSWKRNLAIDLD